MMMTMRTLKYKEDKISRFKTLILQNIAIQYKLNNKINMAKNSKKEKKNILPKLQNRKIYKDIINQGYNFKVIKMSNFKIKFRN